MDLQSWIRVHTHAYAYFGGTTQIIVPDNLKASVTKHTSQELILNPTYREMAEHYNTVVMPARVRAPKDKSSVEGSVSTVSTWIIAALRNTQCFSIDELNEAIEQKLADFNQRAFTRKQGNRLSAFETEEKFALSPLPATPYNFLYGEQRKSVQTTMSLSKVCFILCLMSTLIGKLTSDSQRPW